MLISWFWKVVTVDEPTQGGVDRVSIFKAKKDGDVFFIFSQHPFDVCARESCPVTQEQSRLGDQVIALMLPKRWTKTRGRGRDTQQTLSQSPWKIYPFKQGGQQ